MDQGFNPMPQRVLVAPLDWGLGHATRCIPIIRQLLRRQCTVFLGGEDKTHQLLRQEFPGLSFVDLKGYRVEYSKNKWTLPFVIASQIPKILSVIKYENQRLREIVKQHRIDAVISDNRYGLYHPDVPSVFITHQLMIRTPLGRHADRYLQNINYRYISRFQECWVPDNRHHPSLGGLLSHPVKLPSIPVRYLGPLSRFSSAADSSKEQHLLILLSGPEPQRSLFEALLLQQLQEYSGPVVFVRGLPGETRTLHGSANISFFNHLPALVLQEKLAAAAFVISRSGYSTVMDLAALKKKSILIPTPGQTEQEYLATHLMESNFALCLPQEKFRLSSALQMAGKFKYALDQFPDEHHLDSAIHALLYKTAFHSFAQ